MGNSKYEILSNGNMKYYDGETVSIVRLTDNEMTELKRWIKDAATDKIVVGEVKNSACGFIKIYLYCYYNAKEILVANNEHYYTYTQGMLNAKQYINSLKNKYFIK